MDFFKLLYMLSCFMLLTGNFCVLLPTAGSHTTQHHRRHHSSSMRRRPLSRRSILLLLFAVTLLMLAYSSSCQFQRWVLLGRIKIGLSSDMMNYAASDASERGPDAIKRVLWWTGPMFGRWESHFGLGRQPFLDAGCAENRCEIVTDRDWVRSSAAVVFHWPDTHEGDMPLPQFRPAGQVWILFNTEPPLNYAFDMAYLNGRINWTWTYRTDSDLHLPYGEVRPRTSDDERPIRHAAPRHNDPPLGLVSWLASNCHTEWGRERYVAELTRHATVHTYGGCGSRTCPEGERSGDLPDPCQQLVYTRYKFYLALENCVCRDYVTEKFFDVLQEGAAVPVVIGGADYLRVAPPGSYVDASKFQSPQHLAEYLVAVAANETSYAEFGLWRRDLAVVRRPTGSLCRLCERLHEPVLRRRQQVYDDLRGWWMDDARCRLQLDGWDQL